EVDLLIRLGGEGVNIQRSWYLQVARPGARDAVRDAVSNVNDKLIRNDIPQFELVGATGLVGPVTAHRQGVETALIERDSADISILKGANEDQIALVIFELPVHTARYRVGGQRQVNDLSRLGCEGVEVFGVGSLQVARPQGWNSVAHHLSDRDWVLIR